MKKLRFLALLLVLVMTCVSAVAETTDANDPVVVRVGDSEVLLSEVQSIYDYYYETYAQMYAENGWEMTAEEAQALLNDIIEEYVQMLVMDAKIAEYGFDQVSEEDKETLRAEIEASFETDLEDFAASMGLTVDEAREMVAAEGITPEYVYESNLPSLPYARLQDYATESVSVTDEEVQKAYEDEYVPADKEMYGDDVASYEMNTVFSGRTDIYYVPEGFRYIKHILLAMPDDVAAEINDYNADMTSAQNLISALNTELGELENTPDEAEAAEEGEEVTRRTAEEIQADIDEQQAKYDEMSAKYAEAEEQILPSLKPITDEIYAKLDEGASFDELIAEYNTDPGMAESPNGYLVHKDSTVWDTIFRDAAMALTKVGDVSEPIVTDFGVHIIQYAGDAGGPVELTPELAETVRENLLLTRQEEAYLAAYEGWAAEMEIERHPELVTVPEAAEGADTPTEEVPSTETEDGDATEDANEDGSIG